MSCKCGTPYQNVDGRLICPNCGRHASYQSMPSQAELIAENAQLKEQIAKFKADIEYYKRMWLQSGGDD